MKPMAEPLRCNGCGRRVGYTSRTQPVPVQCTDVFCAAEPPTRSNEERDSFLEHMYEVGGASTAELAELTGMTRQGVERILSGR